MKKETAKAAPEAVAPEAKTPAKAPAKRAAAKAKAAPEKVEEVYVQMGGGEWSVAEVTERAKAAYAAEGHRLSSVKKLAVYIKPEEGRAYYVVNGKSAGSVEL